MTRRAALVAGLLVVAIAGWTCLASILFIVFGHLQGQLDQIGWPLLAWWLYAANSPDGWTTTLLVASGTVPLAIVAGGAIAVWRLRRRFPGAGPGPRPLYGDSQWASEAEQRKGGVTQSRSPWA